VAPGGRKPGKFSPNIPVRREKQLSTLGRRTHNKKKAPALDEET